MDSHKLPWHPDRVHAWMKGERIAPLHIDVGLSRGCNIRCQYCFGALQGNAYEKGLDQWISREVLLNYVRDAGAIGVRSMAFIGEGEPLLNPHVYEAIVAGKRAGVDIALGTNGILLDTGRQGEEALEHLTWIRFNLSAASAEAYRRIHSSEQFEEALTKIRFAVDVKRRKNLPVTIGVQMVLTPQNLVEAHPLARLAGELGVDYFVVKQCSDTRKGDLGVFPRQKEYGTDQARAILAAAESCSTDAYQVIVKWPQLRNQGNRSYDCCLGVPFLLYSTGDGRIFPCGMFFGSQSEKFLMGDLNRMSFRQIVESDRYWQVVESVRTQVDVRKDCYSNCRTNAINEYLWMLRNPPDHVNFI